MREKIQEGHIEIHVHYSELANKMVSKNPKYRQLDWWSQLSYRDNVTNGLFIPVLPIIVEINIIVRAKTDLRNNVLLLKKCK